MPKEDPIEILKNKIINGDERFVLNKKKCKNITFLNCYSYYIYRKNCSYYTSFHGIHCDGFLLKNLVKLVGIQTKRKSFDMTSLAPEVFENAEKNNHSVAIVGSKDEYLRLAIENIKKKFVNLNIVESRHGFFENENEKYKFLEKIKKLSPDIVIVGMGTPLQDLFLKQLKDKGWTGIGYTCGGFIHQTATKGTVYYPKFIDRYNLRWLYRIYDEPKLMKRYAFYYPLSILLFFYDVIKYKLIR